MDDLASRFGSLRPFLVFECAARSGSFSSAAKAFNVSQPSITRNIAQLEQAIGVELFRRGARGSELTAEGRELFHAISQGLGTITNTLARLEKRNQEDGNIVRLSVSGSFVAHWMAPRLASFRQEFPDVQLRFHLLAGLMNGMPDDADLAIRVMDRVDESFLVWNYAPEIVLPMCNANYQARPDREQGETFLHFSGHPREIWDIRSNLGVPGIRQGDVCHEFDDYSVLLQAALDGSGIALGWISVTSRLLLEKRLVAAGGGAYWTGRTHQLIGPGAGKKAKPVVPLIADWLCDTMTDDLKALEPILGKVW